MTLNPGQKTTLSVEMIMHGAMGGKHDFRVHLKTNDLTKSDYTVDVLSNWIQ